MNELKLARPREVPMLRMAGYEVAGWWSDTFLIMQISRETNDNVADPLVDEVAALACELERQP
jgi:hypothetical protein